MPLPDRFWAKVNKTDGCWLWTAATNGLGYGVIGAGVRGSGRLYAHRVAYELLVGPIPVGLELDHLCCNPTCVNPDHLEPVTHRENLRRAGRARTGSHCVRGHERSDANTYVDAKGKRYCRVCNRISHQRKAA